MKLLQMLRQFFTSWKLHRHFILISYIYAKIDMQPGRTATTDPLYLLFPLACKCQKSPYPPYKQRLLCLRAQQPL